MRHFEARVLAERYARYRPQIHTEVFKALELKSCSTGSTALDVACGTGHSTIPLLTLAERVIGCDVSKAMLSEARRTCPGATFVMAPAEALPLKDEEADLVTVGFAFHWFDGITFLREAARVLKVGGSLVLYNFNFPGVMQGEPEFTRWYRETYLERFPVPPRHRLLLHDLLAEVGVGLESAEAHSLERPLTMNAQHLRNYLTTQSNVSVALEAGERLDAIDAQLDAKLAPFFSQELQTLEYAGKVTRLERR